MTEVATDTVHDSWCSYINQVQTSVDINFYGNISTLRTASNTGDFYIPQLQRYGLCLEFGKESPINFLVAINTILKDLTTLSSNQSIGILWPARMVKQHNSNHLIPVPLYKPNYNQHNNCNNNVNGNINYSDNDHNDDIEEDGVLTPLDFIQTLADGYFPMGGPQVLHTNQSLAEHDLAHMTSFITNPQYMTSIRDMARCVLQQTQLPGIKGQQVLNALADFNSPFSLRLYYAVEAYICIDPNQLSRLQQLLTIPTINNNIYEDNNTLSHKQIPLEWESVNRDTVENWLLSTWSEVGDIRFMCFLSRLYESFPSLTISLGGESLDLINRTRKFDRPNKQLVGKYERSNLHYWHQKGLRCLRNIRPNHHSDDGTNMFRDSIINVHTPFIGALVGTSQLTIQDWVSTSAEFQVPTNSKLYKYICESQFWSQDSLLFTSFQC